jgi:hypothetical protein
MGSLNPVLWIFFVLIALAIDSIALLISIPIGVIIFFYQKRKKRPMALLRAIVITILVFLLLFIVGCIISLISFQGPLAS